MMDDVQPAAWNKRIVDLTTIVPLVVATATAVLATLSTPQGASAAACVGITGLLGTATAAILLRKITQLRATQTRLASALEAIPDGVAIFDATDRFVFYNDRYPEHLAQPLRSQLARRR